MSLDFFTFTRNSVANQINEDGSTTSVAVNVPVINFRDGAFAGYYSQVEATNLALKSEELDDAGWRKDRVTIAPTADVNPRGEAGSFNLAETAETNSHAFLINSNRPSVTSGLPYAASFYVKKNSGVNIVQLRFFDAFNSNLPYANFNINTGVVTLESGGAVGVISDEGNDWYRISLAATTDADSNTSVVFNLTNNNPNSGRNPSYTGSTSNTVLVQFAQFEEGSSVSSYIPTGATTATRDEDVATITNVADKLGLTAGSCQITALFPTDYPLIVNGLQATVTGIKTIRFEYTTSEIKLFVDNVLADSATGTYDWSTLNEIQLGHYDGLSQPNFELRDFIVRKA